MGPLRSIYNIDIRVYFFDHMSHYEIFWYIQKIQCQQGRKQMWCTTSIPSLSCPKSYIGQTVRLLDTRVREHIAAVKKGETATSAVAEHVWEKHHQMAILARETNKDQRCYLELYIVYSEELHHQP